MSVNYAGFSGEPSSEGGEGGQFSRVRTKFYNWENHKIWQYFSELRIKRKKNLKIIYKIQEGAKF